MKKMMIIMAAMFGLSAGVFANDAINQLQTAQVNNKVTPIIVPDLNTLPHPVSKGIVCRATQLPDNTILFDQISGYKLGDPLVPSFKTTVENLTFKAELNDFSPAEIRASISDTDSGYTVSSAHSALTGLTGYSMEGISLKNDKTGISVWFRCQIQTNPATPLPSNVN